MLTRKPARQAARIVITNNPTNIKTTREPGELSTGSLVVLRFMLTTDS